MAKRKAPLTTGEKAAIYDRLMYQARQRKAHILNLPHDKEWCTQCKKLLRESAKENN